MIWPSGNFFLNKKTGLVVDQEYPYTSGNDAIRCACNASAMAGENSKLVLPDIANEVINGQDFNADLLKSSMFSREVQFL